MGIGTDEKATANAPLRLEWSQLLPGRDDSPPPEVELIAGGSRGWNMEPPTNSDVSPLADLSDRRLQEKIQRLSNSVNKMSSALPDGGEKLRSSLRQMQDELKRREILRTRKDAEEHDRVKQLEVGEMSSLVNDENPHGASSKSHSSFAVCFSNRLKDKEDAAFSEELRFTGRDKHMSLKEKGVQMHQGRYPLRILSQPTTVSFRELPFQCFTEKDKEKLSSADFGDLQSSSTPMSSVKRKLCRRFSTRKASSSKNRDSLDWEFQKVHEVVLLDDEDGQIVQPTHQDVQDEWKYSKIFYPSRDDPEVVEISYSDIKCLDPESYLSSTIMNFYIQYIQRSVISMGRSRNEYYVFNTYFYTKLEEAVSCKGDKTACFLRLRRWWKGVDIFQKAYIFLPIHGDQHWSLVVICIPSKEGESGPIILHFDSLGLHKSKQILATVDSYLKEEWNYVNKNSPPLDLLISKKIWKNLPCRIERKKITVPQQKNDYDCGLFVLYFMERFIREAPDRLRTEDIAMFGRKWFRPEEASSLRKRLRDLLMEEFESNRLESSPTSSCGSEDEKEPSNES